MCKRDRIMSYIKAAIDEIELAEKMAEPITEPNEFGKNLNGMTIFRACSMSIQCITENFIKVRNHTKNGFFKNYNTIPWKEVFGMRNFGDYAKLCITDVIERTLLSKVYIPKLPELTICKAHFILRLLITMS